jgi:hypothetical protein
MPAACVYGVQLEGKARMMQKLSATTLTNRWPLLIPGLILGACSGYQAIEKTRKVHFQR